jgi:dihydrofolate reductase
LLALICAMSQNRVIGKNNHLPWYLPADLVYFKTITLGQTVVMGRKTYESIGHPLPDRQNIVLSTTQSFHPPGVLVVRSNEAVLQRAATATVFIIGGFLLYQQFLPYAGRIYLTLIEATFEGDVFFPRLDATWKLVSQTLGFPDQHNPFPYQFLIYEKV